MFAMCDRSNLSSTQHNDEWLLITRQAIVSTIIPNTLMSTINLILCDTLLVLAINSSETRCMYHVIILRPLIAVGVRASATRLLFISHGDLVYSRDNGVQWLSHIRYANVMECDFVQSLSIGQCFGIRFVRNSTNCEHDPSGSSTKNGYSLWQNTCSLRLYNLYCSTENQK